jgi:hypothetical protein
MGLRKVFTSIGLIVCTFLSSESAMAGPVRCSVNNQDSTCVGQITTAWQTAPACPSTPGYTTVAPAQWQGSHYSAPQCYYQAPPTCPTGFTQTSASVWNGSSWSAPGCTPVQAPPPPPAQTTDPATVCNAYAASQGYPGVNWTAADGVADSTNGTVFSDEWTDRSWGQSGLTTLLVCEAKNGAITYWVATSAADGGGG